MITTLADLEAALLVGGDVVCDPTVTIDVTGGVTVGLPTRLLGGSFVVSSGPAFTVTSSNVEVSGIQVTAQGGTSLDTTQKLIYALGTQTAPLTGIDVHDCRLSGSASDNVWIEWCIDSTVHACSVSDFLNSGVLIASGDGITITGNTIRNGHLVAGTVEVYGIAVTDTANTVAARSRHVTVTGNVLTEIDWEAIDTHGVDGIVVCGNTIRASRRAIALVTGNTTRVTAPVNCVVSGNHIDGTGARVTPDIGIFLAGATGLAASATITGNTISGYDSAQPISTINWDRTNTVVGGNSRAHVPWTAVTLAGGWTGNASFPPQYMVDGNAVSFRGGVVPPSGGISAHPVIGSLSNAAAWPAERTFYATTKGSSATAGIGVLNVDTDGTFRVDYGSTSDTFTYWLTGTYQAI